METEDLNKKLIDSINQNSSYICPYLEFKGLAPLIFNLFQLKDKQQYQISVRIKNVSIFETFHSINKKMD